MSLKAQMEADVVGVFLNTSEHADTVSYTPAGSTPRSIDIVWYGPPPMIRHNGTCEFVDNHIEFLASTDPVTGMSSPGKGDSITLNDLVYSYEGHVKIDGAMHCRFSSPQIQSFGPGRSFGL